MRQQSFHLAPGLSALASYPSTSPWPPRATFYLHFLIGQGWPSLRQLRPYQHHRQQYLESKGNHHRGDNAPGSHAGQVLTNLKDIHRESLHNIRFFLKSRSCYDVFPVSFKVIVLDTKLEVKKALQCLLVNGQLLHDPLSVFSIEVDQESSLRVSGDSDLAKVAGVLTVSDFVNLMAYYYKNSSYETAIADVESLRLDALPEVELALGRDPQPMLSMHPNASLWDASKLLAQQHARRLPLIDTDSATGHDSIISVLTQYRLLKFIAINCKDSGLLHLSLRKLNIGTFVKAAPSEPMSDTRFSPIRTAMLDTPVFDVVQMFSEDQISAVPIVDENGRVINLYETVDVISLVKSGSYYNLDMTVAVALNMRSPDFPGVVTCHSTDSLATLLGLIKIRRVHRLVVIEGDVEEREGGTKGRLLGVITLADILRYIVGHSPSDEGMSPATPARGEPYLSPDVTRVSSYSE